MEISEQGTPVFVLSEGPSAEELEDEEVTQAMMESLLGAVVSESAPGAGGGGQPLQPQLQPRPTDDSGNAQILAAIAAIGTRLTDLETRAPTGSANPDRGTGAFDDLGGAPANGGGRSVRLLEARLLSARPQNLGNCARPAQLVAQSEGSSDAGADGDLKSVLAATVDAIQSLAATTEKRSRTRRYGSKKTTKKVKDGRRIKIESTNTNKPKRTASD